MISGIDNNMGNLHRLSEAVTRSISPENKTGGKGMGGMAELDPANRTHAARDLGAGWKISPTVVIKGGDTHEAANIIGSGAVQHIWLTPTGKWRNLILRIYWDGQEHPSVECPIGDFFCSGWGKYARVSSLAVCVNPGSAFNCYWTMPFRKNCRITLENIAEEDAVVFYQIDYALAETPDDCAYFHARFGRTNPLPYKSVYTILDGVKGKGHYVGTYMAWGVHNNGWWGEGEIKFYIDGDTYPTICGTGTEDYFCGSYNFEDTDTHNYAPFGTPYSGFYIVTGNNMYEVQKRFGLYRWHITDPVRFDEDLRVTIQALGHREGGRLLPLQDDISSVAFWYQTLPSAPLPKIPDKDYMEVI
ncbi:MAG: DUF2961 domain-containing protein [Firmicutes bacterium]|nr:DUF2961 domain-containing protein [Bacillota bacterium]